jgi:tripartite-type tricarboxylate transporter receptor subunit TctC
MVLGTSTGLSIAPALGTKLAYDPQKDFAPIGLAVYAPYVLILQPSIPATNMKTFIDYAKSQPGKLNYGSSGTGTPNHLGGELLDILAGVRTVHVPYKGGGPATIDLLAGQLQFMFSAIPQVLPHVKTGRLRAIAVGHPTRTRAAPDLPAVAETLPGFNNTTWYGVLAPARTPREIVSRINTDLNKVLSQPEFAQRVLIQGIEAATSTPEGLGELMRAETERWRTVIKRAGIATDAIR